jgi:TolA-binding protein
MTTRNFILNSALIAALAGAAPAAAQSPTFGFVQKGSGKGGTLTRSEQLYNEGTAALNDNNWDVAVQKFGESAKAGGTRAAAATYWKAYALNRLGRRNEALNTIRAMRTAYPKSRWVRDADALEVEMRGGDIEASHQRHQRHRRHQRHQRHRSLVDTGTTAMTKT